MSFTNLFLDVDRWLSLLSWTSILTWMAITAAATLGLAALTAGFVYMAGGWRY
jgi:hypothetical protein